jgi:hypothetical protein
MNKDDIIRMAREAECSETWGGDAFKFTVDELEHFAALVAEAEREACMKRANNFTAAAYAAGAAAEADRIANESKHIIKRAEERGAAAERADAERYRWLRDNNASFSWNPSRYNQETISGFAAFGTGYCGFEFEAAVDKAMGSNND